MQKCLHVRAFHWKLQQQQLTNRFKFCCRITIDLYRLRIAYLYKVATDLSEIESECISGSNDENEAATIKRTSLVVMTNTTHFLRSPSAIFVGNRMEMSFAPIQIEIITIVHFAKILLKKIECAYAVNRPMNGNTQMETCTDFIEVKITIVESQQLI